jgi:arylsulfatase A-like enzyme
LQAAIGSTKMTSMKTHLLQLASWWLLAVPAFAAERPNVLFLHADDQRPDTIAALGNPAIITPTLDSLARRGTAFRNAYNFGGNSGAVCLPSRNMLLSGKSFFHYSRLINPQTNVVFQPSADDPEAAAKVRDRLAAGFQWNIMCPGDGPNFPVSMQAAGYQTYHHGKNGNVAKQIQARFEINKYLKNDEADRTCGEPGREIADEAITFLGSERDRSRPFFMYLAFGNPHDPRVAAEPYRKQYDPARIPLPKNYLPQHPFDNGELTIRDEAMLPWPRTEAAVRAELLDYYATITAFDHHLGRILDTLKKLGLEENTIVIFSSDQGLAMGSHGLLGKQNLYEHSTRSPLVFAGPGIPHRETQALVYLFDIYPTVCELVEAAVPQGIDGRSFATVVQGKKDVHRDVVFCAYQGVQRALRDERYKLLRYPQIHRTQLFDLQTDPDELHDLSAAPEQQERVAGMLRMMAEQQKIFGDWMPLTAAERKSDEAIFKKPGKAKGKRNKRS